MHLKRIFSSLILLGLAAALPINHFPPAAWALEGEEQELFLVAQKAFEDGFYDVAIRYIEQFLTKYPETEKRVEANLLLGQCFFFKGQYLKAFEKFQKLLEYSQLQDATLYWLGETYFKGTDYNQAKKYFKQVIDVYPNSAYAPQAYYSLGWTYYEQKQFELAYKTFIKLVNLFPLHQLNEDALFKAAESSYQHGSYELAIQHFKDYLKQYPRSARHDQSYFYIAEAYYYLENYISAVEYYKKVTEISYSDKLVLMSNISQGWSYLKLGQFDLSQKAFAEAQHISETKKMPSDDIYLGQANLFSEMGKSEQAIQAYDELIKRFPDSPRLAEAYLGKANVLYLIKKYPQAAQSYKFIIEKFAKNFTLQPIVEKAYFGLAWTYLKNGQVDLAIHTFQDVELETTSTAVKISALTQIGDAYQDIGKLDKALEVYDKILSQYPNSPYADYVQYRQGVVFLKMDRIDSAILSFQTFINNFPGSRYQNEVAYYLGIAYFKKGDWTSARQQLEKFIQEPGQASEFLAEAHYIMGLSILNMNQYEDAVKLFEQTIRDFPSELAIAKNAELGIAKAVFGLGQDKDAVKRFKIIVTKYPDSEVAQDALLWLGEYYLENSDYTNAATHFQHLIDHFPEGEKTGLARYGLGRSFEAQEKLDEAVIQFKLIDPSDKEIFTKAQLAIAEIFSKELDPQKAIRQYQQIAENSPEFKRDAFLKIARVYRNTKNYEQEINAYQTALKAPIARSDVRDAELQFYIGDTYESLNKSSEAVEAYLKIPYLYPKETGWIIKAYLRIARIFEEQKNWQNAKTIYQKIIAYGTAEAKYAEEQIKSIESRER